MCHTLMLLGMLVILCSLQYFILGPLEAVVVFLTKFDFTDGDLSSVTL